MRGFPLLDMIVAIALLAIVQQPLYHTISLGDTLNKEVDGRRADGGEAIGGGLEAPVLVRIQSTVEIREIRVEHLGRVIIEKAGGSTFEQALPGLSMPSEGIEFWVEAVFAERDKRVALGIEIETEVGDVWKRTLWGEGGVIADSVVLVRE